MCAELGIDGIEMCLKAGLRFVGEADKLHTHTNPWVASTDD